MEQISSASTIKFFGDGVDKIKAVEPELVRFLQLHVLGLANVSAKVFVSERDEDSGTAHWQVVLTSPQGRQSYVAVQRSAGGSIYVTKD